MIAVGLGWRVVQLREELPRPVANMASIDLIADSRAAGEETVYLDDGEWLTAVFHPADRCAAYDAVIEGPGPGDRHPVPGLKREDWPLEDPKGKSLELVRAIRDDIRSRVQALLETHGWTSR